jgi:hypothetical protein
VPVIRAAARALALLLVLAPVAAVPAHAACEGCVIAGAARAPLAPPAGTSLAGYGALERRLPFPDVLGRYPHAFWLKPSLGQRDPLAARALVVERDGTRLTWLALDLVAVDRGFTELLAARLGPDAGTLIVSASHTHSGPGGYVASTIAGMLMMDRIDVAVRERIVDAAVAAVHAAEANRGDARVGVASVTGPAVVRSRLGKPLDREIVVLALRRPDGAPVAAVWNFAIHPTMLGPGNRQLSSDVVGAASEAIEAALQAPALFVAGALGDVSPARHGGGALADVGSELAAAVLAGWRAAEPVTVSRLATERVSMALPPPRLSLRNCLGRWVPRWLVVPLDGMFPREVTLRAVSLGNVAWVVVPGELETELGQRVKRAGGRLFGTAFVAGVSDGYLGYFVTAEDYERPTYVTCASVYAAETGDRLTDRLVDLLGALRGRPSP